MSLGLPKMLKNAYDLKPEYFLVLNWFSKLAYNESKAKGWHSKSESRKKLIDRMSKYTTNLHGEVSELWEAARENRLFELCDKAEQMKELGLEPLTCGEEEIADVIIRAWDTAAALKINVAKAVFIKLLFNRKRPHRNGGKLA